MTERPNPILFYHPDGYRVARQDLKGRHSACESFLTAFVEQAQGPDIYALCGDKNAAEDFERTIRSGKPGLTARVVSRAARACSELSLVGPPEEAVAEALSEHRHPIGTPLSAGFGRQRSRRRSWPGLRRRRERGLACAANFSTQFSETLSLMT